MYAYNKHTLEITASPLDTHGLNISRHLTCICNGIQDYKHGR